MKKLLVIAVGIFYLPLLHAGKPPGMPPSPVEVIQPQETAISHGTVSTGELKANRSIIIKSELPGKVVKLNLQEGQMVEPGTILVELDDSVAKATLNQMIAKYDNSLLRYNRVQTLKEKGTGSTSDRDEAFANLRFDEASLNLAKANFEKTQIKAPYSGILGLRHVDLGEYIDPGQPLIQLTDISTLYVDFSVPEKFLTQVKEGQMIELNLEAIPARVFQGRIYAIAPQIDRATHTIHARAAINNSQGLLRPGLFAKIKVVFDKNDHALMVPEQAVFNVLNKSYIYRIVDNKAVLTEVTVGVRENGQVEIVRGLTAKESVAKSGHMKLYDGAQVMDIDQINQAKKSSNA